MHVIQSPGPGHSSVGNAAPSLSGSYDAIGIEQLEAVLRQHIHDYLFPRGLKPRSLRTLEADIGADLSLTPGARSRTTHRACAEKANTLRRPAERGTHLTWFFASNLNLLPDQPSPHHRHSLKIQEP